MTNTDLFDITNGLNIKVWKSLRAVIEVNDANSIDVFISFFREVLANSVQYKQFDYFQQYIYFPSEIYSNIKYKISKDKSYGGILDQVSYVLPLHLKEIVWFTIGLEVKRGENLDDKSIFEKFYFEAFRSYNDFFYRLTRNQDWKLLQKSISYFTQIEADYDTVINSYIIVLKKRILFAVKYWLFFLFENNQISDENLEDLLKLIEEEVRYEPESEVAALLFFRTENLRVYMGWENWDNEERPEGKLFYPPMAANWLTKGFIIDRLRSKNAYFPTENVNEKLLQTIPFLLTDAREFTNHLGANFEKWHGILKMDNIEDFQKRTEYLLQSISRIVRTVIGEKERSIAHSNISAEKVESFQNEIGRIWWKATRVRRIFDFFGNIENVTGQDIQLKRIGPYVFLEKGKIMFIDGENYSPIYGLQEQLANNVARNEDDLFLHVAFESKKDVIAEETILALISKCISELQTKEIVPSVILIEPEYIYKDTTLTESSRYKPTYPAELNPENINLLLIGTFDDIPLFTSHSRYLKNRIIVSDFTAAFKMNYKTDNGWFNSLLSVIVKEVDDDMAEEKFASDPQRWKKTDEDHLLTDEDAKILVKTSVVVDLDTIIDFEIQDPSKFVVGHIINNLPD